ncbi:hypothetical protein HG531_012944 [Fusarium graminearum]|nr:hypothetical protein HG531_012944 [Fusarium graminearum]
MMNNPSLGSLASPSISFPQYPPSQILAKGTDSTSDGTATDNSNTSADGMTTCSTQSYPPVILTSSHGNSSNLTSVTPFTKESHDKGLHPSRAEQERAKDGHDKEGAKGSGKDNHAIVLHSHKCCDQKGLVTNFGDQNHGEGENERVEWLDDALVIVVSIVCRSSAQVDWWGLCSILHSIIVVIVIADDGLRRLGNHVIGLFAAGLVLGLLSLVSPRSTDLLFFTVWQRRGLLGRCRLSECFLACKILLQLSRLVSFGHTAFGAGGALLSVDSVLVEHDAVVGFGDLCAIDYSRVIWSALELRKSFRAGVDLGCSSSFRYNSSSSTYTSTCTCGRTRGRANCGRGSDIRQNFSWLLVVICLDERSMVRLSVPAINRSVFRGDVMTLYASLRKAIGLFCNCNRARYVGNVVGGQRIRQGGKEEEDQW